MLTKEDSELLQEQARRCRDAKERERLRALYAISVGYPIPKVARIFCIDEGTVYRWIERWNKKRCLSDKPKKGRPSRLSEKDRRTLKELLREGDPRKHGINAASWNTKELRDYFSKRGKSVSKETIRRCLREMGAKYVKVRTTSSESERKTWEDFVRVLVGTMRYDPDSILPLFESEFPMPPKGCHGWTLDRKPIAKRRSEADVEDLFERKIGMHGNREQFIRLLKK